MVGVTASALMGVMKPLLGKLSTLLEKYTKLKGVRRQIAFLRDELSSMSTILEMVSESEEANPQVVEWMSQLRELSYDVEDCIEIFTHHLSRDDTSDGFIHRIVSKITGMKARHRLGNQIDKLKGCVVEVSERRKRYELNLPASCSKSVVNDPRLLALYEEADRLVGIDREMETLVKWLTDGIDVHLSRKVVSIVGFGGSGKTTLANQVFQKIKSQFNCTAFVSVSRSPNVNKILADTLLQFHKSSGQFAADKNGDISRMKEDLYFRTLTIHSW